MQNPNGKVDAAARQETTMQGEYKLSDEQSSLASNDLLCLYLRFDDIWFRALYKRDHLITFSLRGLAGRHIVGGMLRGRKGRRRGLYPTEEKSVKR